MIGLIFGDTDFPNQILKTIKKKKINYLIIDLSKTKKFRQNKKTLWLIFLERPTHVRQSPFGRQTMPLHCQFKPGRLIRISITRLVRSWIFLLRPIDQAEISATKPENAGVAQLVEHPICNRAVGSSSLSASTTSPSHHVLTHCN